MNDKDLKDLKRRITENKYLTSDEVHYVLLALNKQSDNAIATFNEGYEKGRLDGKCTSFSNAYDKGVNDGWECASRIINMSPKDVRQIFDADRYEFAYLSKQYTGLEAMKLINEWEKSQISKKITVGDEVINDDPGYFNISNGEKWVVTHIDEIHNCGQGINAYGEVYTGIDLSKVKKTGEHVETIQVGVGRAG